MKKIIKSIPVYLTVVMILCCSLVVPAFATSGNDSFVVEKHEDCVLDLNGSEFSVDNGYSFLFSLPVGEYILDFDFDITYFDGTIITPDTDVVAVSMFDFATGNYKAIDFIDSGSVFAVTEDMVNDGFNESYASFNGKCIIVVNSFGVEPVVTVYNPPAAPGMYYQAFDMFAGFIYGEGVELTAEQNMVLTILATTAVLFVVLFPFLIVFWFIRMFR